MVVSEVRAQYRDADSLLFHTVIKRIWEQQVNDNPNLIELDIIGRFATIESGSIGDVISIDENGKLRVAPHP